MFDKQLPTSRLIQAIISGDEQELQRALDDGADVFADRSGNPPLILAASHENASAFNALLAAGANPNQPNHHGITPAHELAKRGLAEWIHQLASNPMVMLSRNNKAGNTPAHMAASAGHADCIRALAAANAALDEPGKEGKTPLMLAIDRQDLETTMVLLENGANLDTLDETGLSARARLSAWPAAAKLVSTIPPASPMPSSVSEPAALQDASAEVDTAKEDGPEDDFMGIGTISKRRRPNP